MEIGRERSDESQADERKNRRKSRIEKRKRAGGGGGRVRVEFPAVKH